MKLVLGAGVKPRVGLIGPKVRLFAGFYRFIVENHIDSDVVLHDVNGDLIAENGGEFHTNGGVFHYGIQKLGTEPYINIFADLINGPVLTKSA